MVYFTLMTRYTLIVQKRNVCVNGLYNLNNTAIAIASLRKEKYMFRVYISSIACTHCVLLVSCNLNEATSLIKSNIVLMFDTFDLSVRAFGERFVSVLRRGSAHTVLHIAYR